MEYLLELDHLNDIDPEKQLEDDSSTETEVRDVPK